MKRFKACGCLDNPDQVIDYIWTVGDASAREGVLIFPELQKLLAICERQRSRPGLELGNECERSEWRQGRRHVETESLGGAT